eukprot:CAMPEP_0119481228 /NCGR_PEP_ID=MMETSP1344-20130328/9670_1 /TAXON_ID=236787 /ORGANISM="Florenciella parvula, Strain CCMP2471" /LENGTH=286 /DNA_ID=CAMNT_0007515597 /DNA_START=39 /DNA_END=898 /DNA_ORIENTATION=+
MIGMVHSVLATSRVWRMLYWWGGSVHMWSAEHRPLRRVVYGNIAWTLAVTILCTVPTIDIIVDSYFTCTAAQISSSMFGLIWALCYTVIPAYLERVFETRHDKVVKFNSVDGSTLGSHISQRSTAFTGSAYITDGSTSDFIGYLNGPREHDQSDLSSALDRSTTGQTNESSTRGSAREGQIPARVAPSAGQLSAVVRMAASFEMTARTMAMEEGNSGARCFSLVDAYLTLLLVSAGPRVDPSLTARHQRQRDLEQAAFSTSNKRRALAPEAEQHNRAHNDERAAAP